VVGDSELFQLSRLADAGSVQDWLDSYTLWSSQQFRLLKLENTFSGCIKRVVSGDTLEGIALLKRPN